MTAQQPSGTPPKDEPVVKISTALIQIDVTVTDGSGKVVPGLGPADFDVFENGERQKISNLSFISKTSGGATVENGNAATTGDPNAAQPALSSARVGRTIAIVVDDLTLSFASVYYTRQALKKFVGDQMQSGDQVAIIRTGGGVGSLQQFTSDKALLMAAIEKIRWNPFGGSVDALASVSQNNTDLTERFGNESEQMASGNPKQYTLVHPHENVDQVQAAAKNDSRNSAAQEAGIYMQTSLGAIKYVIAGMESLPGRKAMMLFSDGITIQSDSEKSRASSVLDYLRDLTDTANRSSVVVYTFDTKGMQSMAITASDSTYEIIDGHREQKVAQRTRDFKDSQDGLVFLANQTGGKALLDSNDMNGGMQRALDEQAGYYLLGYIPDTETFDPVKRRYNKLEVRVNRPDLKVSYRSGFFNTNTSPVAAQTLSVERTIAKALTSPFTQNEITLNINALYADDPVDGAYIRSFIHIDASGLKFNDDAEGWKKATFDVSAVTFGDNGLPVESADSKYTIKTKGPTYDSMLKNGFVYVLMMPIKKAGVYQYRVALRDADTGKIGSASQVVEVPNLVKQGLAISSLAVEGVTPSIWQNITQGKVGNNPGQMHVASTLLYDTVMKQFVAGNVLRYGFEVYNAKLDGPAPRLETQVRILQNNKVVVEGAVNKFDASTQTDMKHIKISAAVMLRDTLAPGDYVLQVIVNDTAAKKRAVQIFPFEIIK